jgi:hypothetical protein
VNKKEGERKKNKVKKKVIAKTIEFSLLIGL